MALLVPSLIPNTGEGIFGGVGSHESDFSTQMLLVMMAAPSASHALVTVHSSLVE